MLHLDRRFLLGGLWIVLAACSGGSPLVFSSSSSEGSSSSSSSGMGGAIPCGGTEDLCGGGGGVGSTTGSSGFSPDPGASPPVVDCVPPEPDPDPDTSDGGMTDGGDSGAGTSTHVDAGPSPCDAPQPDTCTTNRELTHWSYGVCGSNGECQFTAIPEDCPGGCFIQSDGGLRCNNNQSQ